MKKETIILAVTATVFFGVGFLAGAIWKSNAQQEMVSGVAPSSKDEASSAAAAATRSPGPTPSGLPDGHPPVDTAALVKTFEDDAAQNPRDPEPRLGLANLYYDQKQFDKAIEWYRQGLELDPRNVSARTDMATAYYYLGRSQEAIKEYRKSLETDPRHGPTLYNMIVVNLDGTHDLAAAREAQERLQKLNPSYPGLAEIRQRLDAARASASGGATP